MQAPRRFRDAVVFRELTPALLIAGLFCANPGSCIAQGAALLTSPKEALQSYRELDASGERLTASGWHKADRFFVRPEPLPHSKAVAIFDTERIDDHGRIGENRAEIAVMCSAVGQIDSLGRFTNTIAPLLIDSEKGHLTGLSRQEIHGPAPLMRMYELVLTDTRWEFDPKLASLHPVKGEPDWRIKTFESEPWVTIEAAVRYLIRLGNESNSDLIKSNTAQSVSILRKISTAKPHRL